LEDDDGEEWGVGKGGVGEMDVTSGYAATPNSGPGMRQGKAASRVALIRGLHCNLSEAFGRAFPGKTPARSVGDGLSAGGDNAILTRFLEASAEAHMGGGGGPGMGEMGEETPIPASMAVLRAHEERLFGTPSHDAGSPMDVSPCVEDRSLAALASEKHLHHLHLGATGTPGGGGARQPRTVHFEEGVPYVPSRMRVSGMPEGGGVTRPASALSREHDFKVPLGGAVPVSMTPTPAKAGRRAAPPSRDSPPGSRDVQLERARAGEARALRELDSTLAQLEEERAAQEQRFNTFRKEATREKRELLHALQVAQDLAAGGGGGGQAPQAGGWEARANQLELELKAERQQARSDAKVKAAEIFDLRKRAQKAEHDLADLRKMTTVEREDADKSIASLQKRLAARKQEVEQLKGEVRALREGAGSGGRAQAAEQQGPRPGESEGVPSPATTSAGDSPVALSGEGARMDAAEDQPSVTVPKKDLDRLKRQARTCTELAGTVRELTRARADLEARAADLQAQLEKAQRAKSARPNREELMRVANLATETLFRELHLNGQAPSPAAAGRAPAAAACH